MVFGLCQCFGEGIPGQKAPPAPLAAASTGGTHGTEEVSRDGLREAATLLVDVWALFVLVPVQSSTTFPSFPLRPRKNFPLNLSVLSPQSFW